MDTSSWLGKAVSRYSRSLSPEDVRNRNNKPPRWRTPSPINASMIPPPIVASVHHPAISTTKMPTADLSPADTELDFFRQKQRKLEGDLQLLLDAQVEGLLSGLGGISNGDDALSTGSSTPTALSARNNSSLTPDMPRPTRINLREARRGLHTNMRRLALLKAQEYEHLIPDIQDCDAVVNQLDIWEKKKERLQERTRQIHEGDEYAKTRELRQKADNMQNDINDLEARLAHLKTQQRKLRREATECDNEVQAKLSSYTASLGMLEQKSKDFVTDLQKSGVGWAGHVDAGDPSQARQSYSQERTRLARRQERIEREKEALEEGATIWKDVVNEVSEFERQLREDMARLGTEHANSRETGDEAASSGSASRDIQGLIAKLEQTTVQLESKYKLAQARDWKLLVAAIGAELEAFLKGREILEAALEAGGGSLGKADPTSGGQTSVEQSIYDDFRTPRSSVIRHSDPGKAINELDRAFEGGERDDNDVSAASDTDESDGPDPELLISHQQDTDTE